MKPIFIKFLFLYFSLLSLSSQAFVSSNIALPVNLQCEHLVNPLGIDAQKPRLSWRLSDVRRGAKQTAYRIVVGIDSIKLTDKGGAYWDSGKKRSDACLVSYNGKPLEPFTKYFWLVEVWDRMVNLYLIPK